MRIKLKDNQSQVQGSSKADDWHGPWGRINPIPRSVETLRICKGTNSEELHSYPYRVLSSWHLRCVGPDREELKIEAGADLIIVTGYGLSRIVTALDQGALEVLSEMPGPVDVALDNKVVVTGLTWESFRQLAL
jgi:hypothetical protein